jgi:UrcA family protein
MTYKSLIMATALLALTAPTTAQAKDSTENGWRQDRPWLQTKGPDKDGNYKARISVSDLDLATEDGERQMMRRVKRGISWTCWLMTTDPGIVGDRPPSESLCRKEVIGEAQPQIDLALEAARRGEQVAILNLGGQDKPH